MALGETEPIDLTLDDDEDSLPPSKRAKTDESSDSDVGVVPEPQAASCVPSAAPQTQTLGNSEDLIVTSGKQAFLPHTEAKCKDDCNAHAGSARFCAMRDDRLMKASSDMPAHPNTSYHLHPSSSAYDQPAARLAILTEIQNTIAAHLSGISAQPTPTGLPEISAATHPATAVANASARAARCNLVAHSAEAAPPYAASLRTPAVPGTSASDQDASSRAGECVQPACSDDRILPLHVREHISGGKLP